MNAWVVPRSSSDRDERGGRVEVDCRPVAVVGVGEGVWGWYRIQKWGLCGVAPRVCR